MVRKVEEVTAEFTISTVKTLSSNIFNDECQITCFTNFYLNRFVINSKLNLIGINQQKKFDILGFGHFEVERKIEKKSGQVEVQKKVSRVEREINK